MEFRITCTVAITEQASGCTQSIVNRLIDFLIVNRGDP